MSTPTKASRTGGASSTKHSAACANAAAAGTGPGRESGDRKRSLTLLLTMELLPVLMA